LFCSTIHLHTTITSSIDFQRDYGRGQDHLSAFLEEGDVVVFQAGIWWVDGVQVGDGEATTYQWAKIDTLQVVWSHNCEHGVLRGIVLKKEELDQQDGTFWQFYQVEPMEMVEFGPEQLVARVPVQWENEEQTRGQFLRNDDDDAKNSNELWLQATG
jgi:hypothetical protein